MAWAQEDSRLEWGRREWNGGGGNGMGEEGMEWGRREWNGGGGNGMGKKGMEWGREWNGGGGNGMGEEGGNGMGKKGMEWGRREWNGGGGNGMGEEGMEWGEEGMERGRGERDSSEQSLIEALILKEKTLLNQATFFSTPTEGVFRMNNILRE